MVYACANYAFEYNRKTLDMHNLLVKERNNRESASFHASMSIQVVYSVSVCCICVRARICVCISFYRVNLNCQLSGLNVNDKKIKITFD